MPDTQPMPSSPPTERPPRWTFEGERAPGWRSFWTAGRSVPGYTLFDFLHGYVYARWTYLYIGVGTGQRQLPGWARWLARAMGRLVPEPTSEDSARLGHARGYHGKVMPLVQARQLVRVEQDIRLTDLEHVIPYPVARDIVLEHPDHIVALECPCRASRPTPCLPLDVCLIVGEPFASLVLKHHATQARPISSAEAEKILEAEHGRGHVHHAFFKDAMLGRFYAICNCCPCCCGAMQSTRNGTPMLASSGYVSAVDEGECLSCGLCAECCPFDALFAANGVPVIDPARCMGCGVCVSVCSNGALSLERDPARPAPLILEHLLAQP